MKNYSTFVLLLIALGTALPGVSATAPDLARPAAGETVDVIVQYANIPAAATTNHDAFTIGAGQVDLWAAYNNTDTPGGGTGHAASPFTYYDTVSHTVKLSMMSPMGTSLIWGDYPRFRDRPHLGRQHFGRQCDLGYIFPGRVSA